LSLTDCGDVIPPAYCDTVRPPGKPRNEEAVVSFSQALAQRVAAASANGAFLLVLGGDCSIVLGDLLGVRRACQAPIGLVYLDAHADFATPEESRSGSVASMCLALAVGRGNTPLARLSGEGPLTRAGDVVLLGRRDDAEPWYGQNALADFGILDLSDTKIRQDGFAATAQATLDRVGRPEVGGFWIHIDADVLDPAVLPAVDSPEPGGLDLDQLAGLLIPLVRNPRALGLELTIYDPALDANRNSASRLLSLLEKVLLPEEL
jgi:arginase